MRWVLKRSQRIRMAERLSKFQRAVGQIPGILPAAAIFIMTIGLLSAAGPARRAIRVDPTEADEPAICRGMSGREGTRRLGCGGSVAPMDEPGIEPGWQAR